MYVRNSVVVPCFLLANIFQYLYPVICTFYYMLCNLSRLRKGKGEGKFHLRTGDKVSDGEKKYSSTLSLNLALEGSD